MRNRILLPLLIILFVIPTIGFSQDISDYLILQNIGPYKISKPEKLFPGEPPIGGPRTYDSHGIIGATGHFPDHSDKTYTVMYLGETDDLPSPTVQVTQHAGSDSDKWLLHEVERGFRDSDNLEAGPAEDTMIRDIDANKIFFYGGGVVGYRWVSNNIVVNIQYTNLSGPKPEPLAVVEAYLAKHPSTITLTDTELKSTAHNETWIKDEMDRRLWLGDKWFIQTGVEQNKVLREVVDHLNVFLDYREKYYGINAENEKKTIGEYLLAKNKAGIKNKLEEYKTWWAANKDKPISL